MTTQQIIIDRLNAKLDEIKEIINEDYHVTLLCRSDVPGKQDVLLTNDDIELVAHKVVRMALLPQCRKFPERFSVS